MDEEFKAITRTLHAFYTFDRWLYENVYKPKSIKYKLLSLEEQQLLEFYPQLLNDLLQCMGINDAFTKQLALVAAEDWGIPTSPDQWARSTQIEHDKVRLTLLQLSREWSSEGASEREATFGKIVEAVEKRVPQNSRVLVPGCGLGRLVYEFVRRGYWTQGNEVSYHMLLALGYVLNRMPMAHSHTVFPYIFKLSHVAKRLYQMRPVTVPDESPHRIYETLDDAGELMSMVAGSFVDLYGPPKMALTEAYTDDKQAMDFRLENANSFDVVATCFFLDTAHNIIDYLKTIHHCLKEGGVWVNMGPLLWHYEGDLTQLEIHKPDEKDSENGSKAYTIMEGMELTREELLGLVDKIGFDIEEQESGIRTSYTGDPKALGSFVYDAEFWVARKRVISRDSEAGDEEGKKFEQP